MEFVGIIPARYGSSRFPGKPLCDINGMPMIWHVYKSSLIWDKWKELYVATDDGRDICNLQVGQAINSYEFNDGSDLYGFNSTLDKITMIPHSDSVKAAWMTTEVAIKSYYVVNRNSNKFSDDKVMKKMAKDFE